MRATSVLQKTLGPTLASMHAFRRRSVLLAVEALAAGRRLTLIDLARHWPGATWVRAALKRVDRLLSNRALHAQRDRLYAGMARWLLHAAQPVIVVDWSDLKRDGRWCLLRAAVPVGGRSLPLLDHVVAQDQLGDGKVHRAFLQRLKALVPPGARPTVVTDAGFRSNWFAAVSALGWDWIGRLRGRLQVRLDGTSEWVPCTQLYARQSNAPRDLGGARIVKGAALPCRLVLSGRRKRAGRQSLTRAGKPSADRRHLKAAKAHREPWLLACSPGLAGLTPRQLVAGYRRRMQIEESFRDLKSHRYGQSFEDSLSRKVPRLEMLLLIHALTTFAAWVVGCAAVTARLDRRLSQNNRPQRQYSSIRIGWELWRYRWPGVRPDWINLANLLTNAALVEVAEEG